MLCIAKIASCSPSAPVSGRLNLLVASGEIPNTPCAPHMGGLFVLFLYAVLTEFLRCELKCKILWNGSMIPIFCFIILGSGKSLIKLFLLHNLFSEKK